MKFAVWCQWKARLLLMVPNHGRGNGLAARQPPRFGRWWSSGGSSIILPHVPSLIEPTAFFLHHFQPRREYRISVLLDFLCALSRLGDSSEAPSPTLISSLTPPYKLIQQAHTRCHRNKPRRSRFGFLILVTVTHAATPATTASSTRDLCMPAVGGRFFQISFLVVGSFSQKAFHPPLKCSSLMSNVHTSLPHSFSVCFYPSSPRPPITHHHAARIRQPRQRLLQP